MCYCSADPTRLENFLQIHFLKDYKEIGNNFVSRPDIDLEKLRNLFFFQASNIDGILTRSTSHFQMSGGARQERRKWYF